MAKMHPPFGHKSNASLKAEPLFYKTLKEELDDEFVVIHSVPWLSSFVHEIQNSKSPIGEIDFLVLHPRLGALAVEVKGGQLSHGLSGFYYTNSGKHLDPRGQLERSIFALQDILETRNIKHVRFGQAYYFPGSKMDSSNLPSELIYSKNGQHCTLTIDQRDNVKNKLIEIMEYFVHKFGRSTVDQFAIDRIIKTILPQANYGACWASRINNDRRTWLKLTELQQECVEKGVYNNGNLLVNGWPGSGKTVILVQIARMLSRQSKKVLILTFNALLANKLSDELFESETCDVSTFHKFCKRFAKYDDNKNWFDEGAFLSLERAVNEGLLEEYDTLLVDESQVIREQGWHSLNKAFKGKKIVAMCDVAQAFSYEEPVDLEFLKQTLGTKSLTLATSLRVPKKVCNRMKLFNEPDYFVENPREVESDSLQEIVCSNQEDELKQVFYKLQLENISYEDICVLVPPRMSVPGDLVPQGVLVEKISKFRGMEKPVVVILPTGNMTDVEFFCAYSRATSKCIVLFDAFDIHIRRFGELGRLLYEDNKEDVEALFQKELTSDLLKENRQELRIEPINKFLAIYWVEAWKCYLLLGKDNSLKSILITVFKMTNTANVFTYTSESRRSLLLIDKSPNEWLEHYNFAHATIEYCENCGVITPSDYWLDDRRQRCYTCEHLGNVRDKAFEAIVNNLAMLHSRQTFLEFGTDNFNEKVTYQLLSKFNQLQLIDKKKLDTILERSSRLISSVITIYTLCSLEYKVKQNQLIFENKDLQLEIKGSDEVFTDVEYPKWNGFFQDCISKLVQEDILIKQKNKIYEINQKHFHVMRIEE